MNMISTVGLNVNYCIQCERSMDEKDLLYVSWTIHSQRYGRHVNVGILPELPSVAVSIIIAYQSFTFYQCKLLELTL